MIEDLLSFEVGPLRQDYLILQWKWEDSSEEIPFSVRDLGGHALDEEESEGESISFEERTRDVIVDDLVE